MAHVSRVSGRFAGAFSLGNVMAFLAPGAWPAFLADLADRLAAGAVWIFQTVNFDPILGRTSFRFPPLPLPGGGEIVREYLARDADAVRFRIFRRIGTVGELISESVLYPQAAGAYRHRHEQAGYELVAHLGSFSGEPFDAAASGANIQIWRRPGA